MSEARFLTPNAPQPHKFFTRRLLIPAASDFLGLVNGALFELCQPHNWEQNGDMTPQETADFFLNLWNQYLVNENEPPDWDNPENVDGEPAQPWYEQLEDWIIQGFLAVTFTPLAALVYQTTVPKIRVAIRTGNIGALFKVLINGIEVWTGDSYAPITDIIERVFDNPSPGTAATVRIIHNGQGENVTGDAKLEFVRGEAVNSMVATILRADPAGCGVQWSTDNGDNWNTIDLTGCISTIWDEKLAGAFDAGFFDALNGQPGPSQPPSPGSCATYHGSIAPGSLYLLPQQVNEFDTITLSNITGGWSIGELSWYCPDGYRFLAGICDHELYTSLESDPLQTARHMALIVKIGEDYYDPLAGEIEVPAGTANENVYILANTGLTGSPSGMAYFDVQACTNAEGSWTYHFQFATGQHGFVSDPVNGCESLYSGGAWNACTNPSGYTNVEILAPFYDVDVFHLTGLRIKGYQGAIRNDGGYPVGFRVWGDNTNRYTSTRNTVGDFDEVWTGDLPDIKLGMIFVCTTSPANSTITDVYVSGRGYCPYTGQ